MISVLYILNNSRNEYCCNLCSISVHFYLCPLFEILSNYFFILSVYLPLEAISL